MSDAPRVRIKIGSLVLHGASYGEGVRLAASLQRELARLLSAGGGAAALAAGPARRAQVDGGTFTSALGRTSGIGRAAAAPTDGTRVAETVHSALVRGATRGASR